ncbi:hypothetical protein BGZ73_007498 [Actinomortierella ambigua]|nr:hypothetical protein BGZ73_007498 [Actinomortierella ambigua]
MIHRLGYNLQFDYKPTAIFHPGCEADAAAAVQCAAYWNVSVAPRSGGHSYESFSEGGQDGALVIDLNLFQNFILDPLTGVATVGAGMRLGPLYSKLWEAGQYLIPAGTCPTVGVGGHALGGGLGLIGRKYGMLAHSIVGLTMIDASGKIHTVSKSSNQDLFWALRGAGSGSFGLVTEFRFQAYKAPPVVSKLSIPFPRSEYKIVLRTLASWAETLTEDLMAIIHMDKRRLSVGVTVLGSKKQALVAIQPILKLRKIIEPPMDVGKLHIKEGSWRDVMIHFSGSKSTIESPDVDAARGYTRGRSLVYRQPLTDKEMEILDRFVNSPPTMSTYALFDLWGGNFDRQPHVLPSSFDNHQGALFSIQYVTAWSDPTLLPGARCHECLEWSRRTARDLWAAYGAGSLHLEAYQNYAERDIPNALQVYYGVNLPRLQQIKKAFDPANVFRFPQSIPLSR